MSNRSLTRSKCRDLADWSKLLTEQGPCIPEKDRNVKVKLGLWTVHLIGVASESEPGVEVECPAELLALHAEIVALFGQVQKQFEALVETQTEKRN